MSIGTLEYGTLEKPMVLAMGIRDGGMAQLVRRPLLAAAQRCTEA